MPPENFWLPFESDFQIALVTTQSCITWSKKKRYFGTKCAKLTQNFPKWQKLLEIIFVLLYIIFA